MHSTHDDFVDFVVELMATWAPVATHKMYGGYGVFRDDVVFALIDGGQLYFKADDANVVEFEQAGCTPFTYTINGKAVHLSYWSAPSDCLDSPAQMREWCQSSFAAALRAHAETLAALAKKTK
jgi:DNA transformation protein and related proteins